LKQNNQQSLMNKILVIITLLFLFNNNAIAQRKVQKLDTQKTEEQKKAEETYGRNDNWKDRLFFGGNAGGGAGNGGAFILIQPVVGYKITEKFCAGLSPLYIYSSQNVGFRGTSKTITLTNNVIGSSIFARYYLLETIFANTEYLGLSFDQVTNFDQINQKFITERKWNNSLFLGGGYSPSGGVSGVYVMALYDLLWSRETSFYPSPLDIRIGYIF
jgi:hypothetical protein